MVFLCLTQMIQNVVLLNKFSNLEATRLGQLILGSYIVTFPCIVKKEQFWVVIRVVKKGQFRVVNFHARLKRGSFGWLLGW